MGLYSKPPSAWDGDEVCTWLATLNLTQLVPAFQVNHGEIILVCHVQKQFDWRFSMQPTIAPAYLKA